MEVGTSSSLQEGNLQMCINSMMMFSFSCNVCMTFHHFLIQVGEPESKHDDIAGLELVNYAAVNL